MSRKMLLLGAAVTVLGGAALAQVDPQQLADSYRDQGYSWVEVTVGPTQIEIEAVKGTTEVEVVYDRATGQILDSEQSRASLRDRMRNGVEIETTDEDMITDDDDDDEGRRGDDDRSDDDDDSDDRDGDDRDGDDRGGDDGDDD